MNPPPPFQQEDLLLHHNVHRSPKLRPAHAYDEDQLGFARSASEIDLRFAVTEHMHVGRFIIVDENHEAQPVSAVYGDDPGR